MERGHGDGVDCKCGGGWWWVVGVVVVLFVLILFFFFNLMVQDDIPTCEELANTIVADAEAIVRDRLMSCLVEEEEE